MARTHFDFLKHHDLPDLSTLFTKASDNFGKTLLKNFKSLGLPDE